MTKNQGVRFFQNDHGCEIVSGLCELYATVHFAMPGKKGGIQGSGSRNAGSHPGGGKK